jgi:hypothetical protein
MRWWKVLGLAGVAGMVATGAVVARSERRRKAYSPDEIRARLHARLDEPADAAGSTTDPTGVRTDHGTADGGRTG